MDSQETFARRGIQNLFPLPKVPPVLPCLFGHPCDEYVYVLNGTVETAGRECKAGTFWFTPAHANNGPHKAITDVELMTIRLGEMGVFEQLTS